MITFFTVPKAFRGHHDVIQRNAVGSWIAAVPDAQVILCGDEAGTAEAAADLGVEHVAGLRRSPYGAPLLDGVVSHVQDLARYKTLGFVNSDIIFCGDFSSFPDLKAPLLVIGESIDQEVRERLPFCDPNWRSRLPGCGKTRGPLALDYFFFTRGLFGGIPPFALGRARFDNWLVSRALRRGAAVIDGTEVLGAVHQKHDYGHLAGGRREAYRGIDARRNQSLAGWWCYMHLYSVLDARWTLTPAGLQPRGRRFRFFRQLLVRLSGLWSNPGG